MEKEIWKDIKDYENLYQASTLGRIKSLERTMPNRGTYGGVFKVKEKILKPHLHKNNGYYSIKLSKNGKNRRVAVHRLIAETFIPNPNNYNQINHKDENKSNNAVDNLEWCTAHYNSNYGTRSKRVKEAMILKVGKKILQYDLQNTFIKEYRTIREAAQMNHVSRSNIYRVCVGKRKTAGGFIWKYKK